MDHNFRILNGIGDLSPDFLHRNPWMFKSKKASDPDTPTMHEALNHPTLCESFLDAVELEITELEDHHTWDVMEQSDIEP